LQTHLDEALSLYRKNTYGMEGMFVPCLIVYIKCSKWIVTAFTCVTSHFLHIKRRPACRFFTQSALFQLHGLFQSEFSTESDLVFPIICNNQQMQLYAVNFIPLPGSLYMFRVFYTPIIRSTIFNCIYSHWYKP